MNVFAIADLHLSHSKPKPMDVFGPAWADHTGQLHRRWAETVGPDDLVLLPGDISWAMTLEGVRPDLEWIDRLPGTKVMIRGNHDYWWKSLSKVRKALPSSLRAIQNDALLFGDLAVAGTRLWQLPWVTSTGLPLLVEDPPKVVSPSAPRARDDEAEMKYVRREIGRLELSLKAAAALGAGRLAVMLHYPPVDHRLEENEVTRLLTRYGVDQCVYGHLHNLHPEGAAVLRSMELGGVRYRLVSCDFTRFLPVSIY
jgi:predicted phosphohydrolase